MNPRLAFASALVLVGLILTVETRSRVGLQDSIDALTARIEGRQTPNRQGFDPLTLQEVMQRFRVTGVSVAVLKDFKIHWAKGYGVADVETGKPVDTTTMSASTASNTLSLMQIVVPNVLFMPSRRAATLTPSPITV